MRFLKIILILILFLPISVIGAPSLKHADSRAYHAPARYDNNIDKLIEYLIQPYPKNEMLRARVIFAWIVYHIQYDGYEYNTAFEIRTKESMATPLEIFNKRSGVCRDYAKLFFYMAKKAGLEVVIITGMADGGGHAWNAVKINKKWELIDATWATNGNWAFNNIKNDKKYQRAVKKRAQNAKKNNRKNLKRINNEWFMANPQKMFKTHKPDDMTWALLPQATSSKTKRKK